MAVILFLFVLIAIGAAIIVPITYVRSRQAAREQKNYERGLKMVPFLIHLPPPSDDVEGNGRDVRDVTEETISKAQIVYNIIASTFQKGWKNKLYGQRHFSFEIIGSRGFVYFYAAVPISMADVVKQAIVSAYPSARLEEVADHNIFNPVGKINAVAGGELVLKEEFAYPIATFQELKRDAMQALLNSLANLGKEDGVGIQIMLRPADPSWRKKAQEIASKKRSGKEDKNIGAKLFEWAKLLGTALVKVPDEKDHNDKKDLSDLEQAVVNAIDDKTRSPGFEVLIRVIASSNISQRSQSNLSNVVAAFALFDAPGRNGFKFKPSKNTEELATDYILRLFPQRDNDNILNSIELATIFHFPDQRSIPTSQLERQDSKQVDGPRNVPEKGLLLGYNIFRGVKKPIRLGIGDRQRHMYAVGQTGTGKSTFLENLALQDMLSGNGFAFVDPHGDTAEKLLSMVPKERTEDIIYFCPADMDYPMGLNLFEFENEDQKDFLIQEALNMLYKLYDPQHQGIMGPRYEHLFRSAALTIMADPEGGTFIDIPKLFRDPQYVKQKLVHVKDPSVIEFWQKEMPQSQRSNEFGEVVSWFVSKFGAFLSNTMMRNIIGQTDSAFNLRDVMDNKKILLVNLSKGRTGQLNMQLLGMIFVMKFQAAAMSRADVPEKDRVDFALYVDEFQNFSTDSFATIMSEARKYHLNLIVANQFTTQLSEEIRDAVFGNVGTTVAFRVGDRDAESLHKYFRPSFEETDLIRLPNYNTIVRTMIGGVPTQPFSMATLPPLGTPNQKLSTALKQLSAAKFGRPKAQVESEIFKRMETKQLAPSAAGGMPPSLGTGPAGWPGAAGGPGQRTMPGAAPAGLPPAAPARPSSASFLDDWLTKRKMPSRPVTSPFGAPSAPQQSTYPSAPQQTGFNPATNIAPQTNASFQTTPAGATQSVMPQPPAPVMPAQPAETKLELPETDNTAMDLKKNSPDSGHLSHGDTIYIDK
ncbi:MAG TPA: ATP-binding protein [Candidatus Saccharimonadales bacterium]|nr:ATP-binding protein [Candidatus Saccharimonadales bacterium]